MRLVDDPPIDIRPVTEPDFTFLFHLQEILRRPALEAATGWDASREAARLRATIRPGQDQIVGFEDQDIGVLGVTREPHRLWLRRIQLLPDSQGRGLGTAILGSLLAQGRLAGLSVFLRVRRDNPAVRLYERLGFRITAEDEAKYAMTAEPGPRRCG
jgi:ribosomal protein S18 acetylase RimI-like enzyme